jgi:NADPH:quinone reductase-like Zn-dependent oxidoreductase
MPMKAIVWTRYGAPEVLKLQEVEKPTPKANEVLIRIHATTVTAGDCEARSFTIPLLFWLPFRLYMGLTRPRVKILGQELAGVVESAGTAVTQHKPGDQVLAPTLMRFGAYAEYICLPETYVVSKPSAMSYEEAATIPTGGMNSLHFLRKAHVRAGESVLINGAGGSIGTYAVQIAKALGAEVTCVDSTAKLDMLRSLGADHVVDYTQADFTRNGETYDVIVDVVGKSSFSSCIRSLKPNGRYVLGNPSLSGIIRGLWASRTTDKQVIFEPAGFKPEDYAFLKGLIEAGTVKPVIDRCYTLDQVAEAHDYVERGHKAGNVIIRV